MDPSHLVLSLGQAAQPQAVGLQIKRKITKLFMSYIVRRSTINDLPDVYSFELAYIKEIEPTAEQRWRNATHTLLRQWISNLPRMFIAIHGMESIGHCFWQIEGTDALLASIYVVPSWRKQGY